MAESPAAVAGLQPGDSIVSINGIVTPSFYEVGEVLAQNKDKDVLVGFYRAGIPQTLTLHTDTAGKWVFILFRLLICIRR